MKTQLRSLCFQTPSSQPLCNKISNVLAPQVGHQMTFKIVSDKSNYMETLEC